jgi:hypothetical protein
MIVFKKSCVAFIFFFVTFYAAGQSSEWKQGAVNLFNDTITVRHFSVKKPLPDPKTSARLAIIPGAGQLYNRDYWKLPIVYLSLGGGLYAYHLNSLKYHDFLTAYKSFYDLSTGELAKGVTADTKRIVRVRNMFNTSSRYDSAFLDQIKRQKNYWRRYRNVALLTTGAIYVLSIIEANVAAHLKGFDISDDLTLHVAPKLANSAGNSTAPGLQLMLTF